MLFIGYFLRKIIAEKKIISAEVKAKNIEETAVKTAENLKKEALFNAKEEIHALRTNLEKETRERRAEITRLERRNLSREESLDAKQKEIDKKDRDIHNLAKKLAKKEKALVIKEEQKSEELERIASLTKEEAKEELLKKIDNQLIREKAIRIREIEEEIKDNAKKMSQVILANTICSITPEYVAENTVSIVEIPNDEMKGRLIGKEGRNIRAFEKVTGVDLIIDDTPEAVVLSCFDAVRRQIAKVTLDKLISDGRIHPARIEEMFEKATAEIDQKIKEEGTNALFELEINKVHPELVKLLGRLQFRTSYGQDQLHHSIEVAKAAAVIAKQLGLNVKIAKRAALFHDIGKSIDQFTEGTHVELGMQLLKKYGESEQVIHAMSTHHGEYEPKTIEALIVNAADAVSAARPGARRESVGNYIKRLESLEQIANAYDGVKKSYAIQAGRELRVIVIPQKVSDDKMIVLARDISKQIQEELEYPGQVKVNVIRESRSVSYAK